ncbi:MAG: diguanylate cyclase (GGDEF)-like protein, partial [Moritella sp.]
PIIFLSGKTEPEDIEVGINAGGDDYLPKPIQKQVLIAKMTAMERIAAMRNQLLQVTHNLQLANQELEHLAMLDGLTGIANRRYLDISLNKEIARARRYALSLTLIIADIDFFKKYNDHYGHLQGDECLKSVALALQQKLLRPGELVARYGGEEFCMILPDTNEKNATIMAEKLLNAVRALERQHEGINSHALLSISLGVVSIIPDRKLTAKALMQQADKKLYKAKNNGRNQWQI